MTTLDEWALRLAARLGHAALSDEERDTFVWDSLQHQGVPKRAAYASMPELVELDLDRELWTLWGALGVGSTSASARFDEESDDVRTSFLGALDVAAHRLVEHLRGPVDEDEALALLTALAGVLRDANLHRVLENLDAGIETRCARCAAHIVVRRRDDALEINGTLAAPAPPLPRLPSNALTVLEAAQRSGQERLHRAIERTFAPIACPNCDMLRELVAAAATSQPLTDVRRVAEPEATLTMDAPAQLLSHLVSRLVTIGKKRSEDHVRLAGVGEIGVRQYTIYQGRSASGAKEKTTLPSFSCADELDELVNERPTTSPMPSDDPLLDVFAARLFDALVRADAVDVPGFGVFEIREKNARRGATVDGDSAIVPRRRRVVFVASPELKQALNADGSPDR